MAYRLHPDLTFCLIGGEPFFLDIAGGRYFGLAGGARDAFLRLVFDEGALQEAAEPLIARRIVEWTEDAAGISPAMITIPTASVLEGPSGDQHIDWRDAPEIAARLLLTRTERRLLPFAQLVARRRRAAVRLDRSAVKQAALCPARRFASLRRMVPSSIDCLPDSLALFDFLQRRGAAAQIIFGVRRDPFAAHCWVQADGFLLNETVDTASGFTPILAIP